MSPKTASGLGRFSLVLGFLALLGTWYTQFTGIDFLGMSQTHLFNDAIVLSLLGIAGLLDAQLHSKGI